MRNGVFFGSAAFRLLLSAFRLLLSAFCFLPSALSLPLSAFGIPHSAFRIPRFAAYCPAPWTGMSPFCPNGNPKNVEKFVLLLAIRKFPFDGRHTAMSDFPSLS